MLALPTFLPTVVHPQLWCSLQTCKDKIFLHNVTHPFKIDEQKTIEKDRNASKNIPCSVISYPLKTYANNLITTVRVTLANCYINLDYMQMQ